jgi:hypothetical protein
MARVKEITMFDVDHQGQDEEARARLGTGPFVA